MSPIRIEAGTRVRFLNEVGEGVVVQVLSKEKVMIADEDGFEYPYALKELIPVEDRKMEEAQYSRALPSVTEILSQEVSENRRKIIEKDFESRYRAVESNRREGTGAFSEVDLHMHQLVDSQVGLSPAAIIELQLAHFERLLRIGIQQRTKRMVFIHGVGQGVLRHEIWTRIEQFYPRCSCRSADPRKYGSGATEIWISESPH